MASNGNRDVKMTLSVETLGAEEIKKLQNSVSQLAKEGGAAAPEFERLADEIGRLGEQADALRTFQDLATATQQLEQRQAQAVVRATELKARLDEASRATEVAAQAQREAAGAYERTKTGLTEVQGALKLLRSETDAAGKKTAEYKNQLAQLIKEETQLKVSLIDQRKARTDANSALSEAESAQNKLSKQYDSAVKSLSSFNARLEEQKATLESQRKTTEGLGLSTSDLASAQAQLVTALNATGAAARTAKQDADALAAAEADLTAQAARARAALADRIQFVQRTYQQEQESLALAAAAERERAEAARRASEEVIRAKQAEQAESDRLYAIQQQTLAKMRGSAAQELVAQDRAWIEHGRLVARVEQEKANAVKKSSQEASAAIAKAFDTVGARSASELRGEIARVQAAMQALKGQAGITGGELQAAMTAGANRVKELERELRAATNQISLTDRAANLLANSLGQIAVGNLIADGIASLVEQVKGMGREFIAANLEMERLTRTMTVITGSSEGAAQKIQFLRDTANQAGVSMGAVTDSFIRFQASASASGIAAEEVDAIFKSVTVSGSKMGMTSDRVALSLDALGQIASKNTVSMEELRQQLGDSLPGAFAITARGLDVTTEKLVQMVENGQLLAGEFFPAFRRGLDETFGGSEQKVEGLFQSFQRLRNAFRELYQEAAGSSAFTTLAQGMDFLASNLSTAADAAFFLGKAFLALKALDLVKYLGSQTAAVAASTAAITAETVATNNNTVAKRANLAVMGSVAGALNTLGNGFSTVAARGGLLATAFGGITSAGRAMIGLIGGLPGLLAVVAVSYQDLGKWIGETAAKMMGYGDVLEQNEAQLRALEAAEKRRAEEMAAAQAEIARNIRNESLALTTRRQQAEADVAVAEKQVETVKAQADLSERMARLYNDEAIALTAAAEAATMNLEALQAENEAKLAAVAALEAEVQKRAELIAASENVSEKMREEQTELENLLAKKREEAAQSTVSVQNARLEAAERKLASETYKDNAKNVDIYRQAVEDAQKNLAELIEMQQRGEPVDRAVTQAKIELARVTGLYKDATKDATEAIKLENAAKIAAIDAKTMIVKIALEEAKASYEVAKANGNEREAARQLTEVKKLERELALLNLEAKRAEAQASIAVAKAKIEELKASGELTNVKKAEIAALEASIRAKEAEIKITDITTQKLKDLARANDEVGDSANNTTGDLDRMSEGLGRLAGNAGNAVNALESLQRASDGASSAWDKNGNLTGKGNPDKTVRATQAGPDFSDLVSEAESVGGEPLRQRALGMVKDWTRELNKIWSMGYAKSLAQTPQEMRMTLYRMIEEERKKQEKNNGNDPSTFSTSNSEQKSSSVKSSGKATSSGDSVSKNYAYQNSSSVSDGSYTVNIVLNGEKTTVRVANKSEVDALVDLFRSLESAAARY